MDTGFNVDTLPPGLAQSLLGTAGLSDQANGMGSDLMKGMPLAPLAHTPSPQFARDALLAMKAQDLLGKQTALPGAPNFRIPTMVPPAMANNVPQQAATPGMRNPSNPADESMLQDVIESQRPNLGLEGNLIRSFLPGMFSRDTFENYWLGKGPMQLSDAQFQDIANVASNLKPKNPAQVTATDGQPLIRKQFSFYDTPDYKRSLGTASLFYTPDGKPAGFYDHCDFDPSETKRHLIPEIETRIMHTLGPLHGAKDFPIYYGDYVPIK